MATLLHLSDLHLGAGGNEDFGDHKLQVVASDQRESRTALLRSSLNNLGAALREQGDELDAIVVSGDITYQADADGLSTLHATLDELGSSRPANDRIMVVPGNHDVVWGTEPGALPRYERFREHIHDAGFVTPLLEDLDPNPVGSERGVLAASDGSFVVVGLNSADHCGVRKQIGSVEGAVLKHVERNGTPEAKQLSKMWQDASLFDIARVGPKQLEHAHLALEAAIRKLPAEPTPTPLRIATFHHQLLPISLDEEIKPFEALTNLAQVRDWIADNRVDLVLHGHKHVAHTYLDQYERLADAGGLARPWRVLVSSVGTIGLGQASENTIGRLIRVAPLRTRLGKVELTDIVSSRVGTAISVRSQGPRLLLRVTNADSTNIVGHSLDDVHEQIVERVEAEVPWVGPLVCRIKTPPTTDTAPAPLRAVMDDVADVDAWFADTVDLWQRAQPYSAMDFNHGQRILRHDGSDDLVEKVASALGSDRGTSRGVISLLDHNNDDIASDARFPAFCLVQLFQRDGRLNAVGYFRKQEMQYWWPVNVAELSHLQNEVQRKLAGMGHDVESGEIVTVTAIPTSGKSIPRVVVPQVNRWLDDEPHRLTRMVFALLAPGQVDLDRARDDWQILLKECEPSADAADGGPVPIAGIDILLDQFTALRQVVAEPPNVSSIQAILGGLIAQHREYQQVTRRNAQDSELHKRISLSVQALREALEIL